jgi:hypothetical protein
MIAIDQGSVLDGIAPDVGVLLGNGDGTFQPPITYALADGSLGPVALATGDFNNDGNLDVVVLNQDSHDLNVFLGNGDGTLRAPIRTDLGPNAVASLAVGFFDADPFLDVVVTRFTAPGALTILFGNGAGGFTRANGIDLGSACIGPEGVAVADFNRDGKDDIAVTCSASDRVAVLQGDGLGAFSAPTTYDVGATPVAIAAGFVNQADPSPDIAVADVADSNVTVLLSNGDGTFRNDPVNLTNRFFAGSFPRSVAIANVTGHVDGMSDIVVTDGTSSATSSNTLNVLQQDLPDEFGNLQFLPPVRYVAGQHPISVAVADLNGDQQLDVVVANMGNDVDRGNVSVFLNRGSGIFPTAINSDVGQRPDAVAIADFNGDGIPDIVVSNRDSDTISVLLGQGDGTFGTPIDYDSSDVNHPDGPIPAPRFVVVGDFNNDGIPDIAVVNYGTFPEPSPWAGSVSIFLGNGDGTFVPLIEYRSRSRFFYRAAVGNFIEGDPNQDLALIYDRIIPDVGIVRGLIILRGLGNGQFTDDPQPPDGEPPPGRFFELNGLGQPYFFDPSAIVVGDFNNDGVQDLAISDFVEGPVDLTPEHSALKLLFGNGNGTFRAPVDFVAGAHATDLAIGDFNGDGNRDLILSNGEFPGYVTILFGNGAGGFPTLLQLPAGTSPGSVAVADFNQDGIDDIVVANTFHNSVTVGLGNGDGTFRLVDHFATGNFPVHVATANFDNNPGNFPSIITVNNFSDNVSVILNDEMWPAPPPSGGGAPLLGSRSPDTSPAPRSSPPLVRSGRETTKASAALTDLDEFFATLGSLDRKSAVVVWQPDARGLLLDAWASLARTRRGHDEEGFFPFPWES